VADISEGVYAAWDALCQSRGTYADVYATGSWVRSWAAVGEPAEVSRARLVTVRDGTRLRAVLPLSEGRAGRWSSLGAFRYRTSAVVDAEAPDHDLLAALADGVHGLRPREVVLRRMPARDPGTWSLVSALQQRGMTVSTQEVEHDNLAPVHGGWDGHARRYRSFGRYSQRMLGRITPLWDVEMDTYGTSTAMPVSEGFRVYEEIQGRSWKGSFSPAVAEHRATLLRHAERRGWARVFVLRIGDVPAAGHIWFRIGDVAVWLSTAYDQRLASLSPGTVAQWWSHERALVEPAPRLVDLLPGANAQKDRLTEERPPLVDVVATRRRLQVVTPLVGGPRRVASAARRRVRAAVPRRRGPVRATGPVPVRTARVDPGASPGSCVVAVNPGGDLLRYLAVAGAHPSSEAMTRRWAAGDRWFRVGDGPQALVRLGPAAAGHPRPVREVVHLRAGRALDDVLSEAATGLGLPLLVTTPADDGVGGEAPLEEHVPPLPWPRQLDASVGVTARVSH
jgi:CelD/BcsL family acetyltransferase involved in cellulose biosynthesis